MTKQTAITSCTRFKDGKGRVWRVIENLHFGRWMCACETKVGLHGEFKAVDIRTLIAANGAQEAGESLGYATI